MNRLIVGIKVLSAFKHEKLYESAHIAHITHILLKKPNHRSCLSFVTMEKLKFLN